MMGPAHALSGAAVWLTASAAYSYATKQELPASILIMGTAVFSGAALAPDLDSYSSTVTRSFGILGRLFYYITNGLGIFIHGATRTNRDREVDNGHRTIMHTLVATVVMGLLVWGLTSIGGGVNLFGKEFAIGQLFSLGFMAFFLHLGLAGLFAKQVKKGRALFGPYALMAVSVLITILTATALPTDQKYSWLALTVAGGYFVHILGDTITKSGTPLLWPLKIHGKRWYDVALPAPMRITAGGAFEMKILMPTFYALIGIGIVAHLYLAFTL